MPHVHVAWADVKRGRSYERRIAVVKTLEDVESFPAPIWKKAPGRSFIDWTKVAHRFGGIEFSGYVRLQTHMYRNKLAHKHLWYMAIDGSRGCVWNTDLVKSLSRLP